IWYSAIRGHSPAESANYCVGPPLRRVPAPITRRRVRARQGIAMTPPHALHRQLGLATAMCILLLASGCSNSSNSGPHKMTAAEAAAAKASEARAVEVTEHMLQTYRKAKSYTDHATYVEESVLRGEGISHELPYYEITVAFVRPNKLRLT